MKLATILLTSLLFLNFLIPTGKEIPSLEIGALAPMFDVKMKAVSGKSISLKDQMKSKGLLVIFSCNTCPFVVGKTGSEGWQGRYNEIEKHASDAGIGTILINSNEAKRDGDDSFEAMVKHSKDNNYSMEYAVDANSKMADAFGAKTTPHIYLFDDKFKLVYKGAIDDNVDKAAEVKQPWLKNALANLASGKTIDPATTRNIGCSIKRVKIEGE